MANLVTWGFQNPHACSSPNATGIATDDVIPTFGFERPPTFSSLLPAGHIATDEDHEFAPLASDGQLGDSCRHFWEVQNDMTMMGQNTFGSMFAQWTCVFSAFVVDVLY